jgi:hypothetical protein
MSSIYRLAFDYCFLIFGLAMSLSSFWAKSVLSFADLFLLPFNCPWERLYLFQTYYVIFIFWLIQGTHHSFSLVLLSINLKSHLTFLAPRPIYYSHYPYWHCWQSLMIVGTMLCPTYQN